MSTMNGKVLAAIARDGRIGHREFRYAFLMMQEDGSAFTQDEIAEIVGATNSGIQRATKVLREAGYLTVSRPNRHEPNEYEFHLPKSRSDAGRFAAAAAVAADGATHIAHVLGSTPAAVAAEPPHKDGLSIDLKRLSPSDLFTVDQVRSMLESIQSYLGTNKQGAE